jgi:hypothetical protein
MSCGWMNLTEDVDKIGGVEHTVNEVWNPSVRAVGLKMRDNKRLCSTKK